MSVHVKTTPAGTKRFVVRWREGSRNRSRAFAKRRDAEAWDAEVERRKQLGPIALQMMDAGTETLDEYVTGTWAPAHTAHLTSGTRKFYGEMYDVHIGPYLGSIPLRELTSDRIATWQAERLKAGAGREAIRKSLTLLGSILQRALEGGRIPTNPQRAVRKAKAAKREEARPLAPASVEAMRSALLHGVERTAPAKRHARKTDRIEITAHPLRDATLVSVLAYAGLRPGEALALRWGHVGDKTITVNATKTGTRRSVRLLAPLAADLAEWRLASRATGPADLVFPSEDGGGWTEAAYQSWRRRAFDRAAAAAGCGDATPYTLRHSFASLLLHEGRNVIYVARQLGHGANLTLGTYGHVMAELEDERHMSAEDLIRAAREPTALRLAT